MHSYLKSKKLLENGRKYLVVLGLILAFGAFLRAYNFAPWLHFELDQARDVKFVSAGVEEGISQLPMLGPKAGGTFLRLGPVYYYFEYLSALVFGDTPAGHAVFVLFFGVATLPLAYLFLRRYFSRPLALGLLALFSTSVFMVLYSRFAWNPNLLPFFVILLAYGLLRAVDKEDRHRERWFLAAVFALAVSTQLHFLAFFGASAFTVLFLLIKRPHFHLKTWLAGLAIILFLYVPVIVNDAATRGENAKEFVKALTLKTGGQIYSPLEKIVHNTLQHGMGYFIALTGNDQLNAVTVLLSPTDMDVQCGNICRASIHWQILGALFFLGGIALLARNVLVEKQRRRKDFLLLNLCWTAVVFVLFVPLAFTIYPRFFLLTAPLPFVFLGLYLELLKPDANRIGRGLAFSVLGALIALNLAYVFGRFTEMRLAPTKDVRIAPDNILRERSRVTLAQQEMIVGYMETFHESNGYPVYVKSESFYQRGFKYMLEKREVPVEFLKGNATYQNGNHFLVLRTSNNLEGNLAEMAGKYEVLETKPFGTLTVFRLKPRAEAVTAVEQKPEKEGRDIEDPNAPRYTWNDVFEGNVKIRNKKK